MSTAQHYADHPIFGAVVARYTRAQAIDDGVLVDLTDAESETAEVCRQHYRTPVACTAAVFSLIERAVNNPRWGNDYKGVVHDILWMSRLAARRSNAAEVLFRVIIRGAGRQQYHTLKIVFGPGDAGEPVVTIMQPQED